MASVLQKLKLEHCTERFRLENISSDIVGKLSLNEFKELGIQNRNDIMALRWECTKYGSNKPNRNRYGACGTLSFDIPESILEYYIDQDFKIIDISKILCVSESI